MTSKRSVIFASIHASIEAVFVLDLHSFGSPRVHMIDGFVLISMLDVYARYDEFIPQNLRNYSGSKFSEKKLSTILVKHYENILTN